MKKITSQALKTLVALLLAVLMVASTTVTSFAVAKDDLAETGYSNWCFLGDGVSWNARDNDWHTSSNGEVTYDLTDYVGHDIYFRFTCDGTQCGPSTNNTRFGTAGTIVSGTSKSMSWNNENCFIYQVVGGWVTFKVNNMSVTIYDAYPTYNLFNGTTNLGSMTKTGTGKSAYWTKSVSMTYGTNVNLCVKSTLNGTTTPYMCSSATITPSSTNNDVGHDIYRYSAGATNTDYIVTTPDVTGSYTVKFQRKKNSSSDVSNNAYLTVTYPTQSVSVSAGTGGSVSTSSVSVRHSKGASVTATPNTGYTFNEWTATSPASVSSTSAATTTVTTTASGGSVAASFTETKYTVTFTKKLGSAAATTMDTASAGVTTTASYTAPVESGYNFTGWTITSGSSNASNVTGTGSASSKTVSLNASGDVTVQANYEPAGTCGFTLSKTSTTLNIGATDTFTATPNAYHSSGTITASSSNNSVATVSKSGNNYTVTAVSHGTATITVSCTEGGSATFSVTVNTPTISISLGSSTRNIGETTTITPTVTNGGTATVTYSSSNTSVATISGTTITAKAPGTTNITATVDGVTSTAVTLTVRTPQLNLSYSPTSIYATGSATATPTVSVNTSYANSGSTYSNLSYSITSGTSSGTVNSSTGVVTSKTTAGTVAVKVTGTVSYNDVSYSGAIGTANVTVSALPSVYFKHSTTKSDVSNGGTGTQVAMTYDSTASATLGSGAVVYKATLSSLTAAAHYWVIYNGSANRYYATNINSNSGRLGGTGYSTVAHSNGNAGTITPPYTGNTVVYYNLTDGKVYVELPIQVTYQGYCVSQSKNVTSTTSTFAYGATATSTKALSATGYTQTSSSSWYTTNAMSTAYTFPALTGDMTALTIYSPMTANTYTVTLDAGTNGGTIKKTSSDTAAGTMTFDHTYNVSETIASQYNTITPPTGYTFKGWYTTPTGSTSVTSVPTTQSAEITYYAQYTEITGGAVAKAYTDGEASSTGGTVALGSGSGAASVNLSAIGITSANTVTASKSAGYTFNGWTFAGDNKTHLMYSFDGSNYTAVTAGTGTVGTSSNTTIYIKTDGVAGLTTENAEVRAMFVNVPYSVSVTQYYYDDATKTAGNKATVTGASNNVVYNSSVTLTATDIASGYEFIGWFEAGADEDVAAVSTANPYTFTVTDNTSLEARFKKVYYLTFYDTYVNTGTTENPIWTYTASPPRTVTVTRNSATVATYTYSAGTLEQRGEDNQYANGGTKSEDHILSETGTYYEGNKLQVLAGDTVTATYSALASSDVISGIFFNNGIRYTTDLEPDNLYTSREYQPYSGNGEDDGDGEDDDWQYTYRADTTLYADARYYPAATADIIGGQTYQVSANNIVQNTHAVTWTAKSDYLNIDLELASKKQIVFSDTKNTVINSLYTDNYYSIGDDISTGSTAATRLAVYAKGNANQTNTITLTNVKLYYYDSAKASFTDASGNTVSTPVELTGGDAVITKNISAGSSIANSDSTDSTAYIYFTGTMPATDVYVDLDVAVTYKMYIGSKMMSDTIGNHDRFADVATVTATPSTTGQSAKTAPNNAAYNSTANTIKAGDTVTYTYSFIGSNGSWYMFNGWYKGDSSGPDLDNGLLSTKQTFTYKPTASTYVYAVGTRDLFINGSKYITGASADWNKTNDVPQNFKMSFDPSLGNKGRYYWEITDTIFSSANKSYTVGTYDYYTWNNWTDQYHWRDNNSIGNSFFQFFDESTGWNRSVWDQLGSFQTIESGKIQYGKVLQHDDNNFTTGSGYIYFNETTHNGYSSPIRIYYDPDTKATTVEPTYVYNHIYVSNGFNGIDTTTTSNVTIKVNNGTARANNTTNDSSFTQYMKFNGSGWTPSDNNSTANIEGHISDITIGAKDATVTISKTVASSSYKVSSFVVYDLYNDSVKSYTPTASSNTYSVNLQMVTGHNLYIVPIIESTSANMKVVVDATQLNKEQWGDLVGCYAWYSSGNAYGGYPGQLMIPSDDGQSFSANFPATNGSGGSLVGITFSNYLDGTKTWLGCTNVLGAVTTQGSDGSGNIIPTYNKITQTDSNYNRTNYKAQTYDYREPVAFYANKDAGASSFLMNFALKQGNANLISWAHADMTGNNILTFKTAHSTWDDVNFEYLTTADGSTYADMNGVALTNKPTASFYVAAKGMVTYSSSTLNKVFSAGKTSTTVTGITYPNEGSATGANVTANNAVQWYVYDASGNYITTILSAGYADKTEVGGATSLIAQKLLDMGYAVDGKAVAISYDKARYCYSSNNTGGSFDAYRFTGQWLQQSEFATAKVYTEVGMLTDNGEELAGSSTAAYGSATVSVDTTKLSHNQQGQYGTGTTDGVNYAYTTIVDGDKQAITLSASASNFAGWYYYDADGEFTQATKETSFTPTYSKDVTYYAMYEARATYAYRYQGRETARSYSVDGGELTEAEITDGNKVAKTRTDFGTKSPGSDTVSIFKKTLTWNNSVTTGMLDNDTAYTMKISNATVTPQSFTVTAHYKSDASGSDATKAKTAAYNTAVDFTVENSDTALTGYYTGHRFIGWYECDSSGNLVTPNVLLSTQANYGMVVTKNLHIKAVYDNDGIANPSDDTWRVFVDDHEITREKYTSTSGTYYNDTIIRVRNNAEGTATTLPTGAEVGILVIDANGSGLSTTASNAKLQTFANELSSGQTGKIGSTGRTVTKVSTTTLTRFGRADLATRKDFSVADATGYSVYAYYKNAIGEYTFSLVNTGTYTVA